MQKLCLSINFYTRKLGKITVFFALKSIALILHGNTDPIPKDILTNKNFILATTVTVFLLEAQKYFLIAISEEVLPTIMTVSIVLFL